MCRAGVVIANCVLLNELARLYFSRNRRVITFTLICYVLKSVKSAHPFNRKRAISPIFAVSLAYVCLHLCLSRARLGIPDGLSNYCASSVPSFLPRVYMHTPQSPHSNLSRARRAAKACACAVRVRDGSSRALLHAASRVCTCVRAYV